MYKLTHVIRYTVQSKFFILALLERRLMHGVITGCSFYYLIIIVTGLYVRLCLMYF